MNEIKKQIDYKNLMIDKRWDYIKPNENDIYFITDFSFENGNIYENLPNRWIKFAKGSGQVSLYNLDKPNVIIHKLHILHIIHTGILD